MTVAEEEEEEEEEEEDEEEAKYEYDGREQEHGMVAHCIFSPPTSILPLYSQSDGVLRLNREGTGSDTSRANRCHSDGT